MRELYMDAGWGWNADEKYREMEHRDARFLIAECDGAGGGNGIENDTPGGDSVSSADGLKPEGSTAVGESREADGGSQSETRLAGYCHFRFAWDADEKDDGEGVGGKEDVLYVYEIQVAPWATRRGLGRRMMQALEVRAWWLFRRGGRRGRRSGCREKGECPVVCDFFVRFRRLRCDFQSVMIDYRNLNVRNSGDAPWCIFAFVSFGS